MYHKIYPTSPTMWWVTVNDFYRQLSALSTKDVVYLDDYDCNNQNQVVITFDGIYDNVFEFALPILKHFNYPFELFITSDYVAQGNEFDAEEPPAIFASKEILMEMVANRGRLQWHTRSHPNLLHIKEINIIEKELSIPEEILALDKNGFNWFAYPYGNFNEIVVNEVRKKFAGAVSCHQGNATDKYQLNRITVTNEKTLRKEKIGCIIASYNYGQYLIEAIESVLRQTVIPDVILISDDASEDDTQIIAESYVRKFPTLIRYNRNEKNLGIVAHFNKAIALIECDYVMILGADNRLLSNYIEECVKVLETDHNIAIAYTDYTLFGNRAKTIFSTNFNNKGIPLDNGCYQIVFPEFESTSQLLENLNKGNFIHGSSLFRKEAFSKVGGYIKTEKPEDYVFFTRVIKKGYNAKKASKTNLEYRQHSIEQANNNVYLSQQLALFKGLHTEKSGFENTRLYKLSILIYKAKSMPKRILIKKIFNRLFRRP